MKGFAKRLSFPWFAFLIVSVWSDRVHVSKSVMKEEEELLDPGILSILGLDMDFSFQPTDPCDDEEYR